VRASEERAGANDRGDQLTRRLLIHDAPPAREMIILCSPRGAEVRYRTEKGGATRIAAPPLTCGDVKRAGQWDLFKGVQVPPRTP